MLFTVNFGYKLLSNSCHISMKKSKKISNNSVGNVSKYFCLKEQHSSLRNKFENSSSLKLSILLWFKKTSSCYISFTWSSVNVFFKKHWWYFRVIKDARKKWILPWTLFKVSFSKGFSLTTTELSSCWCFQKDVAVSHRWNHCLVRAKWQRDRAKDHPKWDWSWQKLAKPATSHDTWCRWEKESWDLIHLVWTGILPLTSVRAGYDSVETRELNGC